MTLLPPGVKVHLAFGYTDMRKGIDGLAMLVQGLLRQDPFSGHLFLFRGRKANLLKIVFWDGTGLCLFTKRLEQGVLPLAGERRAGWNIGADFGAGFHADKARRQRLEELQHPAAPELLPNYNLLGRVDPVNLKHVLGDIQTDRGDLHVDGSLM